MLTLLPAISRSSKLLLPAVVAIASLLSSASAADQLISNSAAARVGLKRAWFSQVRVDSSLHKVVHWLLDKDQLFALTSDGTLQAMDAETGKTLWTTEIGNGRSPSAGMAVNSKHVAMLSAGTLYILDRTDGRFLWSRDIGGPSSAAPALGETYAYVVLLTGRVEGYSLDDPSAYVWQYQSHGRTFQSPATTGAVVSWPSDSGMLYVGDAQSPRVLYRVETNDEIVAPPAERDPLIFVGSLDGYLYCFHEFNGSEQWRYSTGFAITSQPAIVGDMAYVASEFPALHAVNAATGQPLWQLPGATQFVALGSQYTYSLDRFSTLIVLDNSTGSIAGRLPTHEGTSAIVNDQSDRIFLTSDSGLVQCLHEIGADEPTWHRETVTAEEAATDEAAAGTPDAGATDATPAPATDSPFEAVEPEDDEGPADVFDDSNPFQ